MPRAHVESESRDRARSFDGVSGDGELLGDDRPSGCVGGSDPFLHGEADDGLTDGGGGRHGGVRSDASGSSGEPGGEGAFVGEVEFVLFGAQCWRSGSGAHQLHDALTEVVAGGVVAPFREGGPGPFDGVEVGELGGLGGDEVGEGGEVVRGNGEEDVGLGGEVVENVRRDTPARSAIASWGRSDMSEKIWANSGDSHFLERDNLYASILPADLAARMPHAVKDPDGEWETVHIDGESFRRRLPKPEQQEFYEASVRAPGAGDVRLRLQDLDAEGIWGELVFPSLGMWNASIKDAGLLREGIRAANDWALAEIQEASARFVIAAQLPMRRVEDAVAELQRLALLGVKAVFLPTTPPAEEDYNRDSWEPLWAAAEEARMVIAFHIGTIRSTC